MYRPEDTDKIYKQEYEYKCVEYYNSKHFNENVNEEAVKGWRVVAVTYWVNFKALLMVTYERKLI